MKLADIRTSFSLHALNYETPPSYHDSRVFAISFSERDAAFSHQKLRIQQYHIQVTSGIGYHDSRF